MTDENEDRMKVAIKAIYDAFDDPNHADSALQFINPGVSASSAIEDTQYVVSKMITALSSAMLFWSEETDPTPTDRVGIGYLLESCAQALQVSIVRERVKRERQHPLKSVSK